MRDTVFFYEACGFIKNIKEVASLFKIIDFKHLLLNKMRLILRNNAKLFLSFKWVGFKKEAISKAKSPFLSFIKFLILTRRYIRRTVQKLIRIESNIPQFVILSNKTELIKPIHGNPPLNLKHRPPQATI